jgi:two-component system sensor histidine kinase ChiS
MNSPKTILVVDEARSSREALAGVLRNRGYRVNESEDGADALQRLLEEPPDLVILDAMLPRRSGIEICQSLKSENPPRKLPVILVTSITRTIGKNDRYWKDKTGADEFMSKPFAPDDLLSRIERLLASPGRPAR